MTRNQRHSNALLPAVPTVDLVCASDLTREGVHACLQEVFPCEDIFDAKDVAQVSQDPGDRVLLVVLEPAEAPDEAMRRALAEYVSAHPLVVITTRPSAPAAKDLLVAARAGRALITPTEAARAARLQEVIGEVCANRVLVPAEAMGGKESESLSLLSPREGDVLALLAEGYTNEGIAERLHVSRSAVEKHLVSIFDKLPLGSEERINRRVRAALLYLREYGVTPMG